MIAKKPIAAAALLGALFATPFEGAAQMSAVSQELISEGDFPVSFEAPSREGIKKTFIKIVLKNGNTWWIGVWDTNQEGYRQAMIQVYLAPEDAPYTQRVPLEQDVRSGDTRLKGKKFRFGAPSATQTSSGVMHYVTFKYDDAACMAFQQHPAPPKDGSNLGLVYVSGYYCAARGKPLTEDISRRLISSLRYAPQ